MKKNVLILTVLSFCLSILCMAPVPTQAADAVAISKDGVPIAYSVYGQGEPTLIFVHGWSCNRSFWRKQVPYFEKKYRVVTLDLAGHGASGQERTVYSMRSFGEDVAAVIRAVRAPQVILIGHSMGGPVILAADEVLPAPVIALIGIDTMQDFEETHTLEEIEEIVKPFKEDFAKATKSFLQSMFIQGTDPEFMDGIITTMSHASPRVGISAMEEVFKTSYVADPPKIKAPVWCLNSDLWPTKPEINRKYVPEFNLRIMPGVGHFLMLESPDEFNHQLDNIIEEIVKARSDAQKKNGTREQSMEVL